MDADNKEVLIFIQRGGVNNTTSSFVRGIETKYAPLGYVINTYYPLSNNYLMDVYKIVRLPTAVVVVNDEEVERI